MKPAQPDPVKLFVGVLYREESMLNQATQSLEQRFGSIDYKSPVFEFTASDYYADEMGRPLFRRFASFTELISPAALPRIKLATNEIEDDLRLEGKRRVNLDPGYLDYHKVVLASAKFNGHKIYLDLGIYADPTLWFEKGRFSPYPYAFPDFKTGQYDAAFLHMRARYKGQRRKQRRAEGEA
ncbi:MAG: DUF4416 family protein [Calditrichaeota bacterium]|nr:MAG: DUF4416 family protein [Calditrichota bacterium]